MILLICFRIGNRGQGGQGGQGRQGGQEGHGGQGRISYDDLPLALDH